MVTSDTTFWGDPKSKISILLLISLFIVTLMAVAVMDIVFNPFEIIGLLLDIGLTISLFLLSIIVLLLKFTIRRQDMIAREGQLAIKNRFKSTLSI